MPWNKETDRVTLVQDFLDKDRHRNVSFLFSLMTPSEGEGCILLGRQRRSVHVARSMGTRRPVVATDVQSPMDLEAFRKRFIQDVERNEKAKANATVSNLPRF